jgi:hypothetical protein
MTSRGLYDDEKSRPRQSGRIQFVHRHNNNSAADGKGRAESYGRSALDNACEAIVTAPNGAQSTTLHRECYVIGGLIAGGALDYAQAYARLCEAARRKPAYRDRWFGFERKIEASVQRGMDRPWRPWEGLNGPRMRFERSAAQEPAWGKTTTADALNAWDGGVDPHRTLAETCLARRDLDLPDELAVGVLRWIPPRGERVHAGALSWEAPGGALIALMRNILTDAPQSAKLTLLDGNACKIMRRNLGPVGCAAVKLDPDEEVLSGLHASEGVETGMAARQLGLRPTWALGDARAISALPVLAGIQSLTLLAEHDLASARAVEACAARWHDAGREVLINRPIGGKDLNDALRAKR